jgi:hypothetical protein
MTGTKNTALRNLLADALGDNMDNGTLNIFTSNATLLADFTFAAGAYGAAAAGVITGSFVSTTISGRATGDADNASLLSNSASGTTWQITALTVGTGTQDVVIDNVSITAGQDVTINSHTWTETASTA